MSMSVISGTSRSNWRTTALLAICCPAFLLGGASAVSAATLTVANGDDSGIGSLRQALSDAAAGDTIAFADNVLFVTLTSGPLIIDVDVSIIGRGADRMFIERNSSPFATTIFRILEVRPGHHVAISGVSIDDGSSPNATAKNAAPGGGIYNDRSNLTVDGCSFRRNRAPSGAAVLNDAADGTAKLTIINSTFTQNDVWSNGGGVIANKALSGGNAVLNIVNSTLSENGVAGPGGDLYNGAAAGGTASTTITNSTLCAAGPAAIWNSGGAVSIGNTILKHSSVACGAVTFRSVNGGGITSMGYNLADDDASGFLTAPGDQVNTDPLLSEFLFTFGGPTRTHLPSPLSPAMIGARIWALT